MFKFLLILSTLSVSMVLGFAHASEEKTPPKTKMGQCQAQASDQKGDARKAFMKTCLSAKPNNTALGATHPSGSETQPKAKTKSQICRAEAKGLKGDERKAKISGCMTG